MNYVIGVSFTTLTSFPIEHIFEYRHTYTPIHTHSPVYPLTKYRCFVVHKTIIIICRPNKCITYTQIQSPSKNNHTDLTFFKFTRIFSPFCIKLIFPGKQLQNMTRNI